MFVQVFLNRQEDADGRLAIFSRFSGEGYQEGDALELVFGYHVERESTGAVLSRVYSDFNRGSPTFVGDEAYPQRSLSVGDVVAVNGVRYKVCPTGFESLPQKEPAIL